MILCFGEVMLRLGAPKGMRLEQSLPGKLEATFGGSEANVAVSLARYGTPVRYVTALPSSPLTIALKNELRGLGVEVVVTDTPNARLGLYFIEQGTGVRGGVVHYDRSGSGVAETDYDDYSFDQLLEGVSGLHVSGITPAVSKKACEVTLKAVESAREKGLFVSCDLNYREKLWQWGGEVQGKELAREWMPRIVEYTDLLIGNESDFSDALGIHLESSTPGTGLIDKNEYGLLGQKVCDLYPNLKYVASSLRSSHSADTNHWGGMLYQASERKVVFAPLDGGSYNPYELEVFDRFGAGDAFAGGLLHALNSEDLNMPEKAIAFATAAGALKHTIHGDYNLVSREEVLRLMHGDKSGRVKR